MESGNVFEPEVNDRIRVTKEFRTIRQRPVDLEVGQILIVHLKNKHGDVAINIETGESDPWPINKWINHTDFDKIEKVSSILDYKAGEQVEISYGPSWVAGIIVSVDPLMVIFPGMDTATNCTVDQIRKIKTKKVPFKIGEEVEVRLGSSWKVGIITSLEPIMVIFPGMGTATECTLDNIRRYEKSKKESDPSDDDNSRNYGRSTEAYEKYPDEKYSQEDHTHDEKYSQEDYTHDEKYSQEDYTHDEETATYTPDYETTTYTPDDSTLVERPDENDDYVYSDVDYQDKKYSNQKKQGEKKKKKTKLPKKKKKLPKKKKNETEEDDNEWSEEPEDIEESNHDWVNYAIILLIVIVVAVFIYQYVCATEPPKKKEKKKVQGIDSDYDSLAKDADGSRNAFKLIDKENEKQKKREKIEEDTKRLEEERLRIKKENQLEKTIKEKLKHNKDVIEGIDKELATFLSIQRSMFESLESLDEIYNLVKTAHTDVDNFHYTNGVKETALNAVKNIKTEVHKHPSSISMDMEQKFNETTNNIEKHS